MRNGQNNNKRMRNRNNNNNNNNNNNRRGQNPMTRVFESNGPDIKIRGTASHVAEKYVQLARDARSSGDPVAAENYYQHAEHYFRLIAAAQEQFRQSQPYYQQGGDQRGNVSDEGYDDGDDQPSISGEPFAPREPQPQQAQGGNGPHGPNGQSGPNGQNGYDGSPDRFPLHRRRRRHRGPRDHSMSNEGDAPMPPGGPQSED